MVGLIETQMLHKEIFVGVSIYKWQCTQTFFVLLAEKALKNGTPVAASTSSS